MTIDTPEVAVAYPPIARRVNGVFKGGGARGLVYAGALHEVRARGVWFESVAGASAGAITATLIAAGYQPDQILELARTALPTVKKNWFSWLEGSDRAYFTTKLLRNWIEARLRDRFLDPPSEPITFQQLKDLRVGIELNVVAMDLARSEPILFNWHITPDFSVAEAVIASSAIPVAMPSRRVLIRRSGKTNQIHRLVDGGTWANYPAFVYRDPSLRSFFDLPELKHPNTLGFVIESSEYGRDLKWPRELRDSGQPEGWIWPPPPPTVASGKEESVYAASMRRTRFDRGSARRMGIAGALLTWAGLRWLILGLIVAGALALIAMWGRDVLAGGIPDPSQVYERAGAMLSFVTVIVVFSLSAIIVLSTIRFGPEAIDAGLPSLLAATSASIGVARWVGHAASDRVIRLSAPVGISVAGFKVGANLQALAFIVAADQAANQLDRLYGEDSRNKSTPMIGELVAPNDYEALYLAQLRKSVDATDKLHPVIGMSFYLLMLSVLMLIPSIFPSITAIVVSILLGLPYTWWAIALLIRGRIHNQAMQSDEPLPPHPLPRFILGAILLSLPYLRFDTAQSSDDEIVHFLGDFLGPRLEVVSFVPFIAGLACMLSGLSRVSARIAARRYRREVSDVVVDDGLQRSPRP
ncbi:patatin-like phospholipase family protein [Diaminobutyricimonas sp. TR449]|uniref:patatin-like phospholipase family protein n=1 Tax=Diaminobutyricimonas sp. TR449 TaxID=2708076 RepID=UPI00141EB76B|nr:patatin-like phospholipase family protein [Diaminobutyricimonas sp. TR449]